MVVLGLVLFVGCHGSMYRWYSTIVLLLNVVISVVICTHLGGVDMIWL